MGKVRQKRISTGKSYKQCLSATELLDFEAESLTKMMTLKWPGPLVRWRDIIGESARQAKNQGLLDTHVSFEAKDPRAKSSEPAHVIELGAQIAPQGHPIVTYFFAIGRQAGTSREGLRKLHFDLECTSGGREAKPKSHMQIAGRLPPKLGNAGYDKAAFDHLLPDLDKPRIPCLPQSFALLVHVALLEYYSSDASLEKFVHSPEWLRIVTIAENRVLKPYFDHGQNWLTSAATEKASFLSGSYGFSAS
jgi:hypothetical protein